MEKTTKKSWTTRAFLISLAALILCSVVNWGVITGWGNVKITKLNLVGDNGLKYTALMYVPKNATNDNPAPAFFAVHGMAGNARNHESWAVEYSRRGFVVLSIDYFGAGDGTYDSNLPMTRTMEVYLDYLIGLPFVDTDRLVIGGHSYGGENGFALACKYQPAAFVNADGLLNNVGTEECHYGGNMIILTGTADWQNEKEWSRKTVQESFISNGADVDTLEPDVVYGSFEEGNAKLYVEIPDQIHEGAFVDSKHIAAQLDFVQKAVDIPKYIDAHDQVWLQKDLVGWFSMHVFALTVVLFAVLLAEKVPFFNHVCQPMPRNVGLRKQGLAISVVAAIVFPLLCLYTGSFGLMEFLGGTGKPTTPIFRMRFSNISMATVVSISVLGILMLILFWNTDGKRNNATIRELGLTSEGHKGFDFVLVGKAFLLSVLAAAAGWTYLALQGAVMGTDFYCLFFGFKPIPAVKFVYYIPYIIVWILCFIVAAIGMNVERRLPDTGNEKKDLAIAMVVNTFLGCASLVAIVIIQNKLQIALGTTAEAMPNWGTDVTRVWGMPIGMAIASAGNTLCYRKTGNIWLGAFLMAIIASLCCVLYGQLW